jgi:ABC-type nitrate/sulfonate/bicarbonate transport system substrate-binding protein
MRLTELSAFPGPQVANAIGYTAEELGFFLDEGLDYTIEYPGSTVKATQTLATGAAGVGWLDSFGIMVSYARNVPLKAVYRTIQGNAFQFGVPQDSPIVTWDTESLRGTRIGISGFGGGEVPVLRGALFRLALQEGVDFELVPIGPAGPASVEALRVGTVQVVTGSTIDFSALAKGGAAIRTITPDYLKSFPGHTYATTPELLASHRAAMVAFLRARTKGVVFAQANLPAAAQIGMDYAPASAEGLTLEDVQEFLQLFFLDVNQMYFQAGTDTYHKFGLQNPADWDAYQTFLIEAGVEDEGLSLTQPVDVNQIVTNELIDEVNDFDFAEIEGMAKEYTP